MNARLAIVTAGVAAMLGLSACADSVTGPETRPAEAARGAPLAPNTASDKNIQDIQMAILSLLDEVKPCLKDGWTKYTTTSGRHFVNVLDCALYAAARGKLVPIVTATPPVLTSVTFDPCLNGADSPNITAVFSGGTATLAAIGLDGTTTTSLGPITSGVPVSVTTTNVSAWSVTVTNAGGSVTATTSNIIGGGVAGCGGGGGANFSKFAAGGTLVRHP